MQLFDITSNTTHQVSDIPPKSHTTLRLLHTSDWHLGKRLFNHSRYDEFEQFLNWLNDNIHAHEVDILIVAGDIFDTATPSNKAQELYYEFLGKVAKGRCRHVVITAGNHDSPTFLDAPKAILKSLNVQVIGQVTHDIHDEILQLTDEQGNVEAVVLAVPYLRDRDVRTGGSFELVGQREHETAEGIRAHYEQLSEHAHALRQRLEHEQERNIPLIATGHLFASGASISSEDDGMRKESFVVGTLGGISASIFAPCLDYVALGHIHAAQKVAKQERIRYCGSPIAMGFGETGKQKQVLIVDFDQHRANQPQIHALSVPVFTKMVRILGDTPSILEALQPLIECQETVYAEIIYTGQTLAPNFAKDIKAHLADTMVLALNIQNHTQRQHVLRSNHQGENLKNLNHMNVFERLLERRDIAHEERQELIYAYGLLMKAVHEHDEMAH